MFDNADDALFPQQFVNARLLVQTLHGVVTAPTAAIQHGAPGDFVYLVKPDDTVAIQVVKTGVTQADVVEVKDGLKPGDKVVTDGLDRLKDGAKVVVAGERGAGKRGQGGQGGQAGAAGSGQATAPTE
jgi:multidrug efflux system membrane fusion protein